jgi:predicted RNase H-like HicB family nuclease
MDRTYRVVLDPDPEEGGYTVTVPAVPGVVTQGATIEQCLQRVREAIELHLAVMAEDGEPTEIELDKGHAEPTLGPLDRATMAERFRLAREIASLLGDGVTGTEQSAEPPAADNHDENMGPRS